LQSGCLSQLLWWMEGLGPRSVPFITGSGPHINDPVTAANHIHIMLNRDHRMTSIREAIELKEQALAVDDGGTYPI
jgi:hypothetical protein